MPNHSPAPLPLDMVSDVVCPWCFIGKRRLDKALALLPPELSVAVNFRPYFLNPWVPREGIDRRTYLETKFGSVERYAGIAKRVAAAAAAEGLAYASDKMKRQPNTLDCHRLILWGAAQGEAPRMKQRLMDLYFTEGADLSDPEVLVKAAVDCNMDGSNVRQMLASDTDVERVQREADAAKEAGIDGVPTFVIGGIFAVTGAQSPDYLAQAIGRAAAERERRLEEQAAGSAM